MLVLAIFFIAAKNAVYDQTENNNIKHRKFKTEISKMKMEIKMKNF